METLFGGIKIKRFGLQEFIGRTIKVYSFDSVDGCIVSAVDINTGEIFILSLTPTKEQA